MPITFHKLAESPEDVERAIRGTDIKGINWVAVVDNPDDWWDFTTLAPGALCFCFKDEMNFNYLFREGKPLLVFFADLKEDTNSLFLSK